MKQKDQSRKEFEMWARERGYQRDELARCSIGIVGPEYFNLNTEGAWQAWQAARVSLVAAQKDAARYQWLRSRDLETIGQGGVFAGMTPQNVILNEEDLDEAIDAAMSSQS